MNVPPNNPARMLRYEQVIRTVETLLEDRVYRPGERIPSIREMGRRLGVGINTVKQAYGILEDRRLIEARPQSGYYVRPRLAKLPTEPDGKPALADAATIPTDRIPAQILTLGLETGQIRFGAAVPSPELVPEERLSRIMASEIRRHRKESVHYACVDGLERLRVQIAKRMLAAGCRISPDEILVTNGACEAVALCLRAVTKPGDTLAIGSPIYFNFLELFRELELKVLEIPSSPTRGLSIEALESALATHDVAACLVISNFNNPLGVSMGTERKNALVRLLGAHGIPLIEDDINGDLAHANDRPEVCKAFDETGNVLFCSSYSKTIAPGYRVGWTIPGRHMEQVRHLKRLTNLASASPTQLAVAEFLHTGGYDRHLRRIRKAYAAKVAGMADSVARHFPEGTRITRPEGGFTLWIELPGPLDSLAFYRKSLAAGITIAPGALFSLTDRFEHCIRLSAASYNETTEWAVKALGEIATDLMARQPERSAPWPTSPST